MTNAMIRRAGVLSAAAALCLATGCADPDTQDSDIVLEGTAYHAAMGPTSLDDPRAAYAALVADDSGTSIRLLDARGRAGLSVPVALPFVDGLAVHPDGFFLVTSQRALYSVDAGGGVEPFGDTDFLWLYGVSVAADGRVGVAAETELAELDADGGLVHRVPTGGAYCWMDLTVDADSDGTSTVVDLWGSTLATFDANEERVRVVEDLPFDDIDITVQDAEGRQWFARTTDTTLYAWDGDEALAVTHVPDAEGVRALLPRPDGSVVAVVQREDGVSGVRVDIDGTREGLFDHPGAFWTDVAPIP